MIELGLEFWAEVKPLLQACLYTDRTSLNGALWYDETLGVNCERDDAEIPLRLKTKDLDDEAEGIPDTDEENAVLAHLDLAVI